jgi:hypothetical protein
MIYNNRNYPHPVLGIGDDFVNGNMNVDLKISSNGQQIEITPIFILNQKDLSEIILKNTATYLSHIYCRGTLYREVYKTQKKLSEPIVIQAEKLNGEVEIDFFICASQRIPQYKSQAFNQEYGATDFTIDRGDIIAYAGKGKFYANKAPEELKSISALMNIDCSGKNREPMYLEYPGEKITIMLSIEDYNNYKLMKNNRQYFGVILSSLVLPALIEALYFLDDETSNEFKENAWYKTLNDYKQKSKYNEPLRMAQNILENPINKCFEHLTIDEAYE